MVNDRASSEGVLGLSPCMDGLHSMGQSPGMQVGELYHEYCTFNRLF